VHIADEKTFEFKRKKRMIGQVDNQAFVLGPTQDLKCACCEFEGK